jgi:hypothetical protein
VEQQILGVLEMSERDFWAGYVPEPDKRQQALDKKAENARELGLDYEPAQQEPVATCPQDIIHAITLYGDARADQDANNAPTTSHERLADCIRLVRKALAEQPAQQNSTCSNALRAQGKAYPRTCKKCGLGPCVELAQQALDKKAEQPAQKRPRNCGTGYCSCIECVVEPAPVAWLVEFENGEQELHFEEQSVGEINTPLYTSPPAQRKPLPDFSPIFGDIKEKNT